MIFEYFSKFDRSSYGTNLFRAGVVLSGVVLLMMAQVFPYIYDKELSMAKSKIKMELAYMQAVDDLKKENSICEIGVFKSLINEVTFKKITDIPCEAMNELKEDCEFAKYEFELFQSAFKTFELLLWTLIYLSLCFYVFSAFFYIENTMRKK